MIKKILLNYFSRDITNIIINYKRQDDMYYRVKKRLMIYELKQFISYFSKMNDKNYNDKIIYCFATRKRYKVIKEPFYKSILIKTKTNKINRKWRKDYKRYDRPNFLIEMRGFRMNNNI